MSTPNFSPDLVAIIDREHARVRDVMDSATELNKELTNGTPWLAMFGRLIALDCLLIANDPEKMMYRLAAWEQLCREHGG